MSVSIIELGIVGICLTSLILLGASVVLGIKLLRDQNREKDQRREWENTTPQKKDNDGNDGFQTE